MICLEDGFWLHDRIWTDFEIVFAMRQVIDRNECYRIFRLLDLKVTICFRKEANLCFCCCDSTWLCVKKEFVVKEDLWRGDNVGWIRLRVTLARHLFVFVVQYTGQHASNTKKWWEENITLSFLLVSEYHSILSISLIWRFTNKFRPLTYTSQSWDKYIKPETK